MTLQQLKYVVTIARTGTIKEAANELYISQPSLTKSIKELEKEMGIKIFDRSKLFVAKPHIFISNKNPLAKRTYVRFADLEPYPCLSFEQGEHNAFYFSEEMFSTEIHHKNIRVRDRATLFNLLIGLNGYTISSGVIDEGLNGENIIAIPLKERGEMRIGYITHKNTYPSKLGLIYLKCVLSGV